MSFRIGLEKRLVLLQSLILFNFLQVFQKTRSGKIMRRILRKIAEDDFSNLGDTSTLAEPAVVDDLIANRKKL